MLDEKKIRYIHNDYLQRENACLKPYATKSQGGAVQRVYSEPDDERLPFQKDRDKIIHSRAFRRLMHKTQVITSTTGDHCRTRLTHTLEVSQIARSISKRLGLNEDLTEAIALGHDLGHTPFGHIGERTLNSILTGKIKISNKEIPIAGDFNHNYQSVYLTDQLENWCSSVRGMNLSLAVRDGILKHTKLRKKDGKPFSYPKLDLLSLDSEVPVTLEGQVTKIADDIAQVTHDLEDGYRLKIIKPSDIVSSTLVKRIAQEMSLNLKNIDSFDNEDLRCNLVGPMVGYLIHDVSENTIRNLDTEFSNKNYPELYDRFFVEFSNNSSFLIKDEIKELKDSITNLYITSREVSTMDGRAEYIITKLFKAYWEHPSYLPDTTLKVYFHNKNIGPFSRLLLNKTTNMQTDADFVRLICNHIAGMTDTYAFAQYKKLYMPE